MKESVKLAEVLRGSWWYAPVVPERGEGWYHMWARQIIYPQSGSAILATSSLQSAANVGIAAARIV